MRYLLLILLIGSFSSNAALIDHHKAAQDLCDAEWKITDRASGTNENTTDIVNDEVASFKAKGYAFSDFSIDETDFIKVSIEGADGRRKMVKEMHTPYSETRDFLKDRMMPVCIKNVLTRIDNKK